MKLVIEEHEYALVENIFQIIKKQLLLKPDSVLCLPSGSSVESLYKKLINDNTLDFTKVIFISLDEWIGLDASDQGSCADQMHKTLYQPLKISQDSIFSFNAKSDDLENECKKMDQLIESLGGIDLILLGLGLNGHIGLNEPNTPFELSSHISNLDQITRQVAQKYFDQPQKLTHGITLGLKNIANAKQVVMLVVGKHKQGIVQTVLTTPPTHAIPATILHQLKNSIFIYALTEIR